MSRFRAGDHLLVDSRPRPLAPGDAVLVRDPRQSLQLTVEVVHPETRALWCRGDDPACPGFDPRPPVGSGTAVAGRVLLGWSPRWPGMS